MGRTVEMRKPDRSRFRHDTIAIVYDFDGTLTPQPMQEYTVLPEIGVNVNNFWKDVVDQMKKQTGDLIATYMRVMLENANDKKLPITRKMLTRLANKIEYFPGITGDDVFFERINKHVKRVSDGKVKIKHYIISAGLKEIIDGTKIRKYFENVFASEYYYDEDKKAIFPNIVVNDTNKTQYIFRINKGIEDVTKSINQHMPLQERAIPFTNILYVGDGLTDVPCMTVTMKDGGYAIAVFRPRNLEAKQVCKDLWKAKRVHFIAPADYRDGSDLSEVIKVCTDTMVHKILFQKKIFSLLRKYKMHEN